MGSTVIVRLAHYSYDGDNIRTVLLNNINCNILAIGIDFVNFTVPFGNYLAYPVDIVIETTSGVIISKDAVFTVEELGNINTVTPRVIQQGVIVNISGYNFLGRGDVTYITAVWLAGVQADQIISQDNSSVIVEAGYSASYTSGNIKLLLNTAVSIVSNVTVSYYQSEILSINPDSGYNATQFNISGINLIQPNSTLTSVTIGNIIASIEEYNHDYIIVRAGEPSIGDINVNMTVRVTSQSGAYIELQNGWKYIAIPNITSVQPNLIVGGEIITIFGMNFPLDNASTVLIGGISVRQLLYANTTVIQAQTSYGMNRSELQQIQIVTTDRSVITSAPLLQYNTINFTILNISPYAGQNGVKVNITLNSVPPNITAVYLAGIIATTITHTSNTSIVVTAGRGSNVTGDVIIETATGLLLGLQNGWSYLPELSNSQVVPQQGQEGTLVTIKTGVSLLIKYNISAVSLAGVSATIINITADSLVVQAGTSSVTDLSDIVLSFQGGIKLLIPQSWTYLHHMDITSVSNNAMGYFGTVVILRGRNFLNGQSSMVKVTLADSISTNILFSNDTTIIFNISQFVDSMYLPIVGSIAVQNRFGFRTNTSGKINFTYLDVDIKNVFPNQGQNGTIVTIQGIKLLAGATSITGVWLNDIPVNDIITTTNNVIVVQAAYSNISTSLGNITYSTDTGAEVTVPNVWRYVLPAIVRSVTPVNGTEGTIVTIRGTELLAGSSIGPSSVNSVYLDGTEASRVLVAFDTLIRVVAGSSSNTDIIPGTVSIHLSSGAWIFTTQTFYHFHPGIIASVSPLKGQNGTVVNITGNLLYPHGDSLMIVTLAGVNALIVSSTTSFIQVVATRPSTLKSFNGTIIIQAISGAVLKYEMNNFTYLQEGIIYSVTPSRGQNGTTVKIKGYNLFGGGNAIYGVWLAGIAAQVIPNSTNECIVVTAGENLASYIDNITGDVLLVSTSGAHVRRTNGWQYTQKGVITNITPSIGQYGTKIIITGIHLLSGATGISSVTIGGVPIDITMSNDNVIRGTIGNPMTNIAFNGLVIITSSDGGIVVSNDTWRYNQPGFINNFTPTTGGNNAVIKITGTNLLGSGNQIVQITVVDIPVANIMFQNNTLIIAQFGISAVTLNITGTITLIADTGAIVHSTDMYTLFVPCNLNQFMVNNSGSINCVSCSSVCASCSGPTDIDCTECTPTSFSLQIFVNGTKQCTRQCTKFANSDRQCVNSCGVGQYEDHNIAENVTFCRNCNDLCAPASNCSGPAPTQCSKCISFLYKMECVSECPQSTFTDQSNNCLQCHSLCNQSAGCTGPSSTDCHSCAHFTVKDNTTNRCIDKCPSNHYINSTTCLPCDPLCLDGCKGNGPKQCNKCSFAGIRQPDGSIECVTKCNEPSENIYYLDNITGICEHCSDLCSPVDGCNGPSASNCHRCRGLNYINISIPATFQFNSACILDCSSMSNVSTQYYNDLVTLSCQLCDSSCDKGCSGPGPSNCITVNTVTAEKTETFEAGTGTIIAFFALCALLIILILICSIILFIRTKRHHSKYSFSLSTNEGQSRDSVSRYVAVTSSAETEFNKFAAVNKLYDDVIVNKSNIDVKANKLQVNQEPEMYVDVHNAPQQSEDYESSVFTTSTAVSRSIANAGYGEDDNLYDDTMESTNVPYHNKLQKQDAPVLSAGGEKRSSMPVPSNPLQISLCKTTSQQQQKQHDSIYEETQIEDSIYDDIGNIGGLQFQTTSKPA